MPLTTCAAIRATALALAGASSNSQAAIAGFARAYSGDTPLTLPPFDANTPWAVNTPGFEIKRYPSCYLTHRMIAGVLLMIGVVAPPSAAQAEEHVQEVVRLFVRAYQP